MIERAGERRPDRGRVAADEVYGGNGPLRAWLEDSH
jgi:hypothetical protein